MSEDRDHKVNHWQWSRAGEDLKKGKGNHKFNWNLFANQIFICTGYKEKKKSITFDECDNSKSVKLNLVSIGQHISGVKGKRTFWMWHIRCEIDWWEIFLNGQFIQQRSYNRPSLFMIEWCYLVVILQIKDTKIQRQTCLEMLHVWFITVELTQPAILFPFKCCHENWTVVREM